MADEKTSAKNGNGASEDSTVPSVKVLGQYLKDLSFENPKAPKILKEPGNNPNLNVDLNVNVTKLDEGIYESAISIKTNASNDDGSIYVVEAVYAGAFEIRNIPAEQLEPLLLINCPAILFPYLRRIISDMTHEGGFPPLLLDPIDFATLYRQRKESKTEGNA